jgi:hypothetical protein
MVLGSFLGSFLPPASGKILSGWVMPHKIVLLSIGQNPRQINRATTPRGSAAEGFLDATTAILGSKEKLA